MEHSNLQRVVAVRDDSSHWYVIPAERHDEFNKDADDEDFCLDGDFDDKWGKYRTGGSLNLIELWADLSCHG